MGIIQTTETPNEMSDLLKNIMNSETHETRFENCLSYLETKIGEKIEAIHWIFDKQNYQSPFEQIDVKTAIRQLLGGYQENIEDVWELEGFKFCRFILENRQPKSLYQFLDWMPYQDLSFAAKYYKQREFVGLVELVGQMYNDLIADEDFEIVTNVTRRILNLCDYGVKTYIKAGIYETFKKAKELNYINSAFEYLEYVINMLPNHRNELKAAFRLCQKLEEINPIEPKNEIYETRISYEFQTSKCAAELKELKNLTMINYDNYAQYLDLVVNFYKTNNISDTIDCAEENLGICVKLLNKTLERSAFSCYREEQENYTDFLRKCEVEDNGAKKQMGFAFEKTYSSTLQTLEEVCQMSLDISCHLNYGTELQKYIQLGNKPTFDYSFYLKLNNLEETRLYFEKERFEELLKSQPFKFDDF